MGAGLAEIVLEVAPYRVPAKAVLVLTRMALATLDAGEVHRYWKGWEPLAVAMGRKVPDDPGHPTRCSCETCRARETARKAVSAQWTALVRAGLIVRVGKASENHRAEYEITLAGLVSASENLGRTEANASEKPGRTDPSSASGKPRECVRETQTSASGKPRECVLENRTPRSTRRTEEEQEDHARATNGRDDVEPDGARGHDDEKGWTDVKLTTESVSADQYDQANAFLTGTIGVERAGDLVGDHLDRYPEDGYMDAVVHVARALGWEKVDA